MKLSVLNYGLACNPKTNAARWELNRQEASRRQRLAEVRGVVQSRRPPRPDGLQQGSRGGSRAPSAEGSCPGSQCSTPVLWKPRARSASPLERLEPLQHGPPARGPPLRIRPAGPRPQPPSEQLSAAPEGAALLLSPGQRREDLQQALAKGGPEAAALNEEMKDWYFSEHMLEKPCTDNPLHAMCNPERLVKPRLPPVPPGRRSVSSEPVGKPHQQQKARAGRHYQDKTPRGRQNSRGDSGSRDKPPRAQAPCAPEIPEAANGSPKGSLAPDGSTDQGNGGSHREDLLQETGGASSRGSVQQDGAAQDLKSAAAIQDWLANAQKRLAALSGGGPQNQASSADDCIADGADGANRAAAPVSSSGVVDFPETMKHEDETRDSAPSTRNTCEAGQSKSSESIRCFPDLLAQDGLPASEGSAGGKPATALNSSARDVPSTATNSNDCDGNGSVEGAGASSRGSDASEPRMGPLSSKSFSPNDIRPASSGHPGRLGSSEREHSGSCGSSERSPDSSRGSSTRHSGSGSSRSGSRSRSKCSDSRGGLGVTASRSGNFGMDPAEGLLDQETQALVALQQASSIEMHRHAQGKQRLAASFRSQRGDLGATGLSYADDFEDFDEDAAEDLEDEP